MLDSKQKKARPPGPKRSTYKAPLVETQHLISTTIINIQVELISTGFEMGKLNGQSITTPPPSNLW